MTVNSKIASAQHRLWQLISPALPVGAYSYSQGLEYAIESGWVSNEKEVANWISGLMEHVQAALDIPLMYRIYRAWQNDEAKLVIKWSQFLLASRESAELLAEDQQVGKSLAILLTDLGIARAEELITAEYTTYATALSLAAKQWSIPFADLAQGYLWAWAENQVAAAIKLVPLGQTAGQRILFSLSNTITRSLNRGLAMKDDEIGLLAPALAIASAGHETQYSRLFRS